MPAQVRATSRGREHLADCELCGAICLVTRDHQVIKSQRVRSGPPFDLVRTVWSIKETIFIVMLP